MRLRNQHKKCTHKNAQKCEQNQKISTAVTNYHGRRPRRRHLLASLPSQHSSQLCICEYHLSGEVDTDISEEPSKYNFM